MSSEVSSDPVCGQPVLTPDDALSEEYAGVTYFFCSGTCLERFIQDTDLFTLGTSVGEQISHDRGRRTTDAHHGYAGPVTFEQSQT